MIDLNALDEDESIPLPGLAPQSDDAEPQGSARPELAMIEPGSVTAQALYRVWRGDPLVIVSSPPGAGKTTLVKTIVQHLTMRSGISIVVATPTREQAVAVANKIAEITPDLTVSTNIDSAVSPLHPGIVSSRGVDSPRPNRVVVRTLASCGNQQPNCDLLIVDEAYQATFAQVSGAIANAQTILMVGDPGQIPPVVTVDTTPWDHLPTGPHLPAPVVFAMRDYASTLSLPSSYRLGPDTVEAISDLYSFPFDSRRPERQIIGHSEIEAVCVDRPHGPGDLAMLGVLAKRALSFVGQTYRDEDGDSPIAPTDIAVVVSHNIQVTGVQGLLNASGVDGADQIAVGTANALQGGEWKAVVALDPLCGVGGQSEHATNLGRLCVMASRHSAHLSWVYDEGWRGDMDELAEQGSRAVAETGAAVREALTRNSVGAAWLDEPSTSDDDLAAAFDAIFGETSDDPDTTDDWWSVA